MLAVGTGAGAGSSPPSTRTRHRAAPPARRPPTAGRGGNAGTARGGRAGPLGPDAHGSGAHLPRVLGGRAQVLQRHAGRRTRRVTAPPRARRHPVTHTRAHPLVGCVAARPEHPAPPPPGAPARGVRGHAAALACGRGRDRGGLLPAARGRAVRPDPGDREPVGGATPSTAARRPRCWPTSPRPRAGSSGPGVGRLLRRHPASGAAGRGVPGPTGPADRPDRGGDDRRRADGGGGPRLVPGARPHPAGGHPPSSARRGARRGHGGLPRPARLRLPARPGVALHPPSPERAARCGRRLDAGAHPAGGRPGAHRDRPGARRRRRGQRDLGGAALDQWLSIPRA